MLALGTGEVGHVERDGARLTVVHDHDLAVLLDDVRSAPSVGRNVDVDGLRELPDLGRASTTGSPSGAAAVVGAAVVAGRSAAVVDACGRGRGAAGVGGRRCRRDVAADAGSSRRR